MNGTTHCLCFTHPSVQEACGQAALAGVPVWFEPVSVPKSTRAAPLLSSLTYASPNEKELAAMAAAARQQQFCCCKGRCGCGGTCSCGGTCCTCRCGSCSTASDCCCCTAQCGGQACKCQPAGVSAADSGGGEAPPGTPAAGTAAAGLRAMLPDVATLLLAGLRHLVLTLGSGGAALCTLAPGGQAVEGEAPS